MNDPYTPGKSPPLLLIAGVFAAALIFIASGLLSVKLGGRVGSIQILTGIALICSGIAIIAVRDMPNLRPDNGSGAPWRWRLRWVWEHRDRPMMKLYFSTLTLGLICMVVEALLLIHLLV